MQEQDLIVRTLTVNDFDKRRAEVFDRVLQGGEAFILKRYNRPVAMLVPVPEAFKRKLQPEEAPGTAITEPVGITDDKTGPEQHRAIGA